MDIKDPLSSTDCAENYERLSALGYRLFALVSPFHFRNMTLLRKVMRRTGMVISGSAALALVHPQQFIPNDIDFYVLPYGFPAILKFVEKHGYEIQPYDRTMFAYFQLHIVVVKLIHRRSRKTVNVITGLDNHVVKLITSFHSTVVMNYISWFGLVVLYPEWTLHKSGLIVKDAPNSRKALAKYVDRGYALHHDVFELRRPSQEHICEDKPYCPTSTRSLETLHDGHRIVEPQFRECLAKYVDPGYAPHHDEEPHICRVNPYCPLSTRSLHDGYCLVEAFEPDEFNIVAWERNMTWTLPVPCFFDSFTSTAQN